MHWKALVAAGVLSICGSVAVADMIVINGRYMVATEDIRGYFYRQSNQQTVFDVRWSDWSTRYRCDDPYDRARVEAALLNLALQLREARSLEFLAFLEEEGFSNCEQF